MTRKATCLGCGRRTKPGGLHSLFCAWCFKRSQAMEYSTDEEAQRPVVIPAVAGVPGGIVGMMLAGVAERLGARTVRINGVERSTASLMATGAFELFKKYGKVEKK